MKINCISFTPINIMYRLVLVHMCAHTNAKLRLVNMELIVGIGLQMQHSYMHAHVHTYIHTYIHVCAFC